MPDALRAVTEEQFYELAQKVMQQKELLSVLKIVHTAYGESCPVAKVRIYGGTPCYGPTEYRHLDRIEVFDLGGAECIPDYTLPFWQYSTDIETLLIRPGDPRYCKDIDGNGDPSWNTAEYIQVSLLEDLLFEIFGSVEIESAHIFDFTDEEVKGLLAFNLPPLFTFVSL